MVNPSGCVHQGARRRNFFHHRYEVAAARPYLELGEGVSPGRRGPWPGKAGAGAHQVTMYCRCSFLSVTRVCPPMGPPGTVLPARQWDGAHSDPLGTLHPCPQQAPRARTEVGIDEDGLGARSLGHGCQVPVVPVVPLGVVFRNKRLPGLRQPHHPDQLHLALHLQQDGGVRLPAGPPAQSPPHVGTCPHLAFLTSVGVHSPPGDKPSVDQDGDSRAAGGKG